MNKKIKLDRATIGKRLRQTRKNLDLTLKEMGEMSGFVVSAVSEMELGKKRILPEYLNLLAAKFNVNLNWIFTGKGSMFLPGYELTWDFGKDNEEIEEMIYLIENSSFFRHEVLRYFMKLKAENKEELKPRGTGSL
ncbi:MAG: helix-turn-helix transcriptional regulator [Candidatus Aminicenantes bacterium]|nr:helix-turn-helix transcriptional regulator [Candidatus Aminicenantes bacterium]